MKYQQIVRAVSDTPWAILPSKLDVIVDIVSMRAEGERLTNEEIQARIGGKPASREAQTQGAVAIIPVYGVLIPRADMMSEMSGATSVVRLMASLRAAVENPQITAIVLDIDSPGGSVFMIPEFAAEIRAARESKPVIAVADSLAASAGYWIGSQADEFVASPSAIVGSIGVMATHIDQSKFDENLGIDVTYIHAGEFKVEGNQHEPLSEEARAAKQTIIDDIYGVFVADVARGRGVSTEKVLADFGQGRVLTAQAALKRGMVDRVETLEATVERLLANEPQDRYFTAADTNANLQHALIRAGLDEAAPDDPLPPGYTATPEPSEAAESGLSFATFNEEAAAARRATGSLLTRADSLRRVTAAKRDQLVAVRDAHAALVTEFDALLAESEPHADAVLAEQVRFEHLQSTI